jgi:hypothetical protein
MQGVERRESVTRSGPPRSTATRLAARGPVIALISTIATALTLEAICRLVDIDFEFKAHAYNTVPIFFRPPMVPVGPAFFRRPGPDRWEGQVLHQFYRMAGGTDGRYRDEPEVSITYDAFGFRNPENLRDWEVVVVGDSFTELGFLPYEELFTTQLGEHLGVRVKNLGASMTGTFTHVFYLAEYGKAPSTRDAVLVFFEGNDFADLVHEHELMETPGRAGGTRGRRSALPARLVILAPQNSFLKAAYRLVSGRRDELPTGTHPLVRDAARFNAYFTWNGVETPVNVEYARPPNAKQLTYPEVSLTNQAIHDWAEAARSLGLRPWLVFMPCKRRVLDGYLAWRNGALPVGLGKGIPEFMRRVALSNAVRFIDVTPALRSATQAGRLTYNAVGDSHLNRLGSLTVAYSLADALAPGWPRDRGADRRSSGAAGSR